MKFDLHTKLRWSEYRDERYRVLYRRALKTYSRHLSRLDFRNGRALLKYFGDSFFHGAEVVSIEQRPGSNHLELQLFTLNDLEDINAYRRARGVPAVSRKRYQRAPVFYLCKFRNVRAFRANVESPLSVMDTELQRSRRPGRYRVAMSFAEHDEVSFDCTGCAVTIKSLDNVRRLTGGLRWIPRCALCRSRLLTEEKIHRVLADDGRGGR